MSPLRADRLDQVRAQVDYHGRRLQLYRRLHGSAPSARLAELEHAYAAARQRLAGTEPAAGLSAPRVVRATPGEGDGRGAVRPSHDATR
jgi:hypothetical protein